jgi:hypothetical protein
VCDTGKVCFDGQYVPSNSTILQNLPSNACLNNPCLNGGSCNPVFKFFICTCPQAFTGQKCETQV